MVKGITLREIMYPHVFGACYDLGIGLGSKRLLNMVVVNEESSVRLPKNYAPQPNHNNQRYYRRSRDALYR